MLIPSPVLDPTGDVTKLFDQILAVDTATIDSGAGGFSTAFNHLMIMFTARTTQVVAQSSVQFTLNNDSGANYDRQALQGVDATASAAAATASNLFTSLIVPGTSGAASNFGSGILCIPSYAQTVAHKTGILIGGEADATASTSAAQLKTSRWRNTAAITRIAMAAGSGNLVAGSQMTVYGLR